jgi:hypothetical protein
MITAEQLLEVFATYNPQIWPMQIVAYILGIAVLILAAFKSNISKRGVPALLAFFWLWVALLFWLPSVLQGYAPGYFFTAIFLIQGVLFAMSAYKGNLDYEFRKDASTLVGIFFVLYALAGYPLVSTLVGHIYPRMSPFGLTPCPVVTFTFGLLLLTSQKVPKYFLVIPFFYALSGVLWISIGMFEDIGMLLSGLLGGGMLWFRGRNRGSLPEETASEAAAIMKRRSKWSLDLPDKT